MARITVEDCLKKFSNRFNLVRIASIRARDIEKGFKPMVLEDSDKPPVIALREIAKGFVNEDYKSQTSEEQE